MVTTLHDHIARASALAAQLSEKADAVPVFDLPNTADQIALFGVFGGLLLLGDALQEIAAAAVVPSIAESAPALDLWRRTVLENPRRFGKLDQSAAWELTALECERAGNTNGAVRARREAAYIVGVRGAA